MRTRFVSLVAYLVCLMMMALYLCFSSFSVEMAVSILLFLLVWLMLCSSLYGFPISEIGRASCRER